MNFPAILSGDLEIRPRDLRYLFMVVVGGMLYFVVAWFSLFFALPNTNASPIWPPSAVGFSLLLFGGYRFWPAVFAGASLVNSVTFLLARPESNALIIHFVSLLIGAGNTLESLAGVYLFRRFLGARDPFRKVSDTGKFIFLVFAMCLASVLIGPAALCMLKLVPWSVYQTMVFTWWLGDVSGILTLAPLILVFWYKKIAPMRSRQFSETILFLLSMFAINWLVFGGETTLSKYNYPLSFVIFPFVMIACFRLEQMGVSLIILLTAVMAIKGTILGAGPFARESLNVSLLLLQSFMVVLTVTKLVLFSVLTQRDEAERQLMESEGRFRTMADTAPVMIWMSGQDALCNFFNKPWLEFRGQTMEQEMGSGWINGVHPSDVKMCLETYMASFYKRQPFQMEYRLKRRDGEFRWILDSGVPRFTSDARFEGYIGSCMDITELKQAEEILKRDRASLQKLVQERSGELLKTKVKLQQANRLSTIGALAATVAHELRNPLGVIQLAAFNIRRKQVVDGVEKHLVNIENKVSESNQIINNLLNYSRIKVPRFEKLSIYRLLNECLDAVSAQFASSAVTLHRDLDAVKNISIEGDQIQIREIFNNIITNAYQALINNSGEITVLAERTKDQVAINIEDNGMGVERADLKKIFEPFFTKKSKGTGLGLAICHELVQMHHGKILIKSQKGVGTKVTVELPSKRALHEKEHSSH